MGYSDDQKKEQNDGTAEVCQFFCFDPQAVETVKESMLPFEELYAMAETFKVLGDQNRVRILYALQKAELCVCDLAQALGMSTSAVSHQLRLLKGAKLVRHRREGKNVYYTLDDEHVRALFLLALEHIRHTNE